MEEIQVHLDKMLKLRNITSKELAEKIGITEANLSILKTGKAKGVRFNTLNEYLPRIRLSTRRYFEI